MTQRLPVAEYLSTLPTWNGFAACHLTDPHGRVLLVHAVDGQGWQHPGGMLEPDELPEDGARRETREETGLSVVPGAVLAFVVMRPVGGRHARFGVIFDGGTLTAEQAASVGLDPNEHDAHRFATVDEWREVLAPGHASLLAAMDEASRTGIPAYVVRTEDGAPDDWSVRRAGASNP